MSLILEALRKSEAERRLGSAPDVMAPMPVLRAPAPRRRRRWVIACLLALAATGIAGGWWEHAVSMPSPQPSASRLMTTPAPTAVDHAITGVASGAQSAPPPATEPQSSAPLRMASPSPAHVVASGRSSPSVSTRAADSMPASASTATRASAVVESAIKAKAPSQTVVPAPVEPAAPAALPSQSPMPVVAPTTVEPALPSIAELMPDERSALPALKVSMHVYADDPAQRFMIVDGQRVGEGARLADGVVLVRIRRDGAEIDVRGRRLLLPNP